MMHRVDIGPELTQGTVSDLGATLPEQVTRGVTEIALAVDRVIQFDSAALEALISFDELARSRGLTCTLIAPSELLQTALEITGLFDQLDIRPEAQGDSGRILDLDAEITDDAVDCVEGRESPLQGDRS